jgi:hypothetical protein
MWRVCRNHCANSPRDVRFAVSDTMFVAARLDEVSHEVPQRDREDFDPALD